MTTQPSMSRVAYRRAMSKLFVLVCQFIWTAFGSLSVLAWSGAIAQTTGAPKKVPYVSCESELPEISLYYKDRSAQRIDPWGSRTVTPIEAYRTVGPLNRKSESPIWLRTSYPSFKGGTDQLVSKKERNTQWIEISVFPLGDLATLPTTTGMPKIKEYYLETDASKRTRLPWGIDEMVIPASAASGAFYQPVGRNAMLNEIPAIYCNAPSTSSLHGTCLSQAVLKPDIYVVFTYSQKLLPCWAQVEEGVVKVVALNLNVERMPPSGQQQQRRDVIRPTPKS